MFEYSFPSCREYSDTHKFADGDKVAAAKLITSAVQKALRGLTAARGQDVAVRREPGNAKGNATQEQHL